MKSISSVLKEVMITMYGESLNEDVSFKADTAYLKNIIKPYKIPDKLIKYGDDTIEVKLPDADHSTPGEIKDPGVRKLKSVVAAGKFKADRLVSHEISDIYSSGYNAIRFRFGNKKVTKNPKKLYHWTKKENVDSILASGLKPTRGEWLIGNAKGKVDYKAIFLIKKSAMLTKNAGFKHFKRPAYALLQIDAKDLDLWVDPHEYFDNPESYMTYKPIPAEYINVKEGKKK